MMFSARSDARGVALLVVLGLVGTVMGLLAAAASVLAVQALGAGRSAEAAVSAHAGFLRGWALGVGTLTERLSHPAPLVASEVELWGVGADWAVEDEGGKLGVPANLSVLPSVLLSLGVAWDTGAADEMAGACAQAWRLPIVNNQRIIMPYAAPSATPTILPALEAVEELAALLSLPASNLERLRRGVSVHNSGGVNVNTAMVEVLGGLVDWHRRASSFEHEKPLQGPLRSESSGVERRAEILSIPLSDPVLLFDPASDLPPTGPPEGFLSFQLPDVLGVAVPYDQQNAFAFDHSLLHPGRNFYHTEWAVPTFQFNRRPVLALLPWVGHEAVFGAPALVARRPMREEDMTQPLGLIWITPESWLMPIPPLALADVVQASDPTQVQHPGLNHALSAAAFTGWISLQGPSLYRAHSEVFAVVARHGGRTARSIVRPFEAQAPLVLSWGEAGP